MYFCRVRVRVGCTQRGVHTWVGWEGEGGFSGAWGGARGKGEVRVKGCIFVEYIEYIKKCVYLLL